MKVFAIRHKPTGEFMPTRMSRNGFGGWSWWREPAYGKPFDPTPRLFPSKQGAQNALTAWMQGRWVTITVHSGGWESPEETRVPVPEKTETPRVREDMEIVELALTGPGLVGKRLTEGRVVGMIIDIGRIDTSLIEQQLELVRRVELAHHIEMPTE
jgi:hypothetical protein